MEISASRLSPDILMPYIPQEQLLSSLVLVSKDMRAAALAATCSVGCKLDAEGVKATSLSAWLSMHGNQVTQLQLSARQGQEKGPYNVKLDDLVAAVPNLESLSMEQLEVVEPADNTAPLASLSALKKLYLDKAGWLLEDAAAAKALSTLTNLQDLQLVNPVISFLDTVRLHGALTAMQQLTRLQLGGKWATNYVLGNFSGVTGLRELQISNCPIKQPVLIGLQHMQQLMQLEVVKTTQLHLQDRTGDISFSGLTALTCLRLNELAAVHAPLLSTFPTDRLQYLELIGCGISGGVAGVTAMLEWLAGMPQLQYLDLSGALGSCLHKDGISQYSALTASPQLQVLKLNNCKLLLRQVWSQLFIRGRKRPALLQLQLHHPEDRGGVPEGQKLTGRELQQLAACCPWLQELHVPGALESVKHITGLSSLQQLTAVTVSSVSYADVSCLTKLRGLRSLTTTSPRDLERGDLQRLSALAFLTCLEVQGVLEAPVMAAVLQTPQVGA